MCDRQILSTKTSSCEHTAESHHSRFGVITLGLPVVVMLGLQNRSDECTCTKLDTFWIQLSKKVGGQEGQTPGRRGRTQAEGHQGVIQGHGGIVSSLHLGILNRTLHFHLQSPLPPFLSLLKTAPEHGNPLATGWGQSGPAKCFPLRNATLLSCSLFKSV